MNILVTGASGFIGRNLVSLLANSSQRDTVFAVARRVPQNASSNVQWITADLGTEDWTKYLPDFDIDVVIHLAQSNHYREFPNQARDIFNVNVRATVELAEWAFKHNAKRFVFTSTGNVYGFKDKVHSEDDSCDPDGMYGASKLSAEILLKPFSQYMEVLVLRLFGVYGPRQTNAMLPNLIESFLVGSEITLAGNIGVKFNPIYVDDCTAIITRLIETPMDSQFNVLNVGGSEVIDIGKIARFLEKMGGKQATVRVTSDCPKQLVGSIEKLNKLAIFDNKVLFEGGLHRTFSQYRSDFESKK